jgi:hypothetical protein
MAKKTTKIEFQLADPNSTPIASLSKMEKVASKGESPLVKSILNMLDSGGGHNIERLAFERDPSTNSEYAALYREKLRLIPDRFLKRIAIQDDLVASIVNARSNHVSAFGRPQMNRFSTGFKVEFKPGQEQKLKADDKDALKDRIDKAINLFANCGSTKGWNDREDMTLSQFLSMQTRNALVVGRFATEIIHTFDSSEGKNKFHSFRPIDAGTIYFAAPYKTAAESVRKQARLLLQQIKNDKFEPEKFQNEEYAWIQVIESKPVQAFNSKECIVHNVYPVTDVELQGYPLTPIDTIISAVTTHINITKHNRLYFESGRATRGMLVIQSDDVDDAVVARIRNQFNASINSVNNAWRMPVFGVGKQETIQFQPIDSGGRDMEFQYLSDTNARVILSAFQMSPEELPGYAHLSRGTNSQALSESNSEYKLEAARDTGIRPLLSHFQDFLNERIFPLVDEELSRICYIRLIGLDAETPEKENIRIQQDAPLHMTFDEVLQRVEKRHVGRKLGGKFPFNPQYQQIVQSYLTFGEIQEAFFEKEGASKDKTLAFYQNPMWFQWQQLQMQIQQMQMQQQQLQQQQAMAQQQAQQQQQQGGQEQQQEGKPEEPPPEGGGGGGQPPEGQEQAPEQQQEAQPQAEQQPQQEQPLTRGLDQLEGLLNKAEYHMNDSQKETLAKQRKMVDQIMKEFERERNAAVDKIADIASEHYKDMQEEESESPKKENE